MAGLARTCILAFVGAGGVLLACGHLPFDEIPADDDAGGTGTGTVDSGGLDANGSRDADPIIDSGRDAADGGCSGPTCVGTFVSQTVGKDTNPGTAIAPVQSIKRAIEIATALGGKQTVYVAGGHYPEKVTLSENVDVLGGYDCSAPTPAASCTWIRDALKFDTAINNQDYEGVLAPKTITRKTVFDGFRVVGKAGGPPALPGSVGITIAGGSPTITNCRITGGDVNAGPTKRSIGIVVLAPTSDPAGALIDRNAISGGLSPDESFGISFEAKVGSGANATSVAVVTTNDIRGGSAPFTSAVFATSSAAATLIKGNDISGGSSTVVGGTTTSSWGVTITSAGTFDRNRINANASIAGTCTQNVNGNFCGGIQSLGSRANIINNIILGAKGAKTCGVLVTNNEGAAAGLGVIVNSNTIDGLGNAGIADGTISSAIAVRIEVGTTTSIGKVRNNILLGGLNKNRYGVYEEKTPGKTAHLVALDNNNFFNPPPARTDNAYHTWDGTDEVDVPFGQLSSIQAPVPSANKNVDCVLDGTYHISSNSECIDKGTSTEAPPSDFEGDNRPKGPAYDIGADEAK